MHRTKGAERMPEGLPDPGKIWNDFVTNPIVGIAVNMTVIYVVLLWLGTAYWAFRDMQARSENPIFSRISAGASPPSGKMAIFGLSSPKAICATKSSVTQATHRLIDLEQTKFIGSFRLANSNRTISRLNFVRKSALLRQGLRARAPFSGDS